MWRSFPSNVDEDSIKISLLKENASLKQFLKTWQRLRQIKLVQNLRINVIGADSVIDLEGKIIKTN